MNGYADLKQKSANRDQVVGSLKDSILGELVAGGEPRDRRAPHKTSAETRAEYHRIQMKAKGEDRTLNKAFASAFDYWFKKVGKASIVVGEKRTVFGSLVPDVSISEAGVDPICLEFTWRTTGEVPEGKQQNTLTPGHIQQYVFQKAYEYVKALGLHEVQKSQGTPPIMPY